MLQYCKVKSLVAFTFGSDTSGHQLPQHKCTSIDVDLQEVLDAEVDGTVEYFGRHVSSCPNLQHNDVKSLMTAPLINHLHHVSS